MLQTEILCAAFYKHQTSVVWFAGAHVLASIKLRIQHKRIKLPLKEKTLKHLVCTIGIRLIVRN